MTDTNTGNLNTGNWNTGLGNTGNWNTGSWNAGNWNTGDWNTGFGNTNEPTIRLFNRQTDMTLSEFMNLDAARIWAKISIYPVENSEDILRERSLEEIHRLQQEKWDNLIESDRQLIRDLPGWTPEIWEEVMGIHDWQTKTDEDLSVIIDGVKYVPAQEEE